jgi:hypothetical protein
MNKRLIAVIIIGVIVIVGLFVFVSQKTKPPVSVVPPEKEIVPPPATGNVDDLVGALLKEITDEESVLKDEEGNTTLVTQDSQEVGNFVNSINESEL